MQKSESLSDRIGWGKDVKKFRQKGLVVASGKNKIIWAFESDKSKHFTISFLPNGIINMHETIQTNPKSYPSSISIDPKLLRPKVEEVLLSYIRKNKIDIKDAKYKGFIVIVPKNPEYKIGKIRDDLAFKYGKIKGKEFILAEDFEKNFSKEFRKFCIFDYLRNVDNYHKDSRYISMIVSNEKGGLSGLLFKINGNFYLLDEREVDKISNDLLAECTNN